MSTRNLPLVCLQLLTACIGQFEEFDVHSLISEWLEGQEACADLACQSEKVDKWLQMPPPQQQVGSILLGL